jgi:hypothetical protein
MSDNISDKLKGYTGSAGQPAARPVAQLVTKPYQALELHKGSQKGHTFKIVDKAGGFDLYSYSHVIEISYHKLILTVTTTSRVFAFTGRNLDKVADHLADRKLKALFEFNTATHSAVDDIHAVVIEEITRQAE